MPGFRFGKHPPRADYRTLLFKSYAAGLAAPPASDDKLAAVYSKLGVNNPATLFPMDGNDTVGDCTCAAVAHAITLYDGLVGTKKIMKKATVLKVYYHLTGGVDSGLDELTVLNYWQSNKVDGEKILAFVKIDPKNHTHIQQAIYVFGGVYLGFQVQENAIQDFDARKPWTPGTQTNDGHAVFATGYDANGLTMLTWGNTQQGTWAWWDECVDEAYALLPVASEKSGFSPGFDFAQLKADLNGVAS
jgi:hypothetical protein